MENIAKIKSRITNEDLDKSLSGNGIEIPLFKSKDERKTLSVICGGYNHGRFHIIGSDFQMWNYDRDIAIKEYNNA